MRLELLGPSFTAIAAVAVILTLVSASGASVRPVAKPLKGWGAQVVSYPVKTMNGPCASSNVTSSPAFGQKSGHLTFAFSTSGSNCSTNSSLWSQYGRADLNEGIYVPFVALNSTATIWVNWTVSTVVSLNETLPSNCTSDNTSTSWDCVSEARAELEASTYIYDATNKTKLAPGTSGSHQGFQEGSLGLRYLVEVESTRSCSSSAPSCANTSLVFRSNQPGQNGNLSSISHSFRLTRNVSWTFTLTGLKPSNAYSARTWFFADLQGGTGSSSANSSGGAWNGALDLASAQHGARLVSVAIR
jgi:hypothetical protein